MTLVSATWMKLEIITSNKLRQEQKTSTSYVSCVKSEHTSLTDVKSQLIVKQRKNCGKKQIKRLFSRTDPIPMSKIL